MPTAGGEAGGVGRGSDRSSATRIPRMRVQIWPAGDENDGTTQYRLTLPGEALQKQGADVVFHPEGPNCLWSHRWPIEMQDPPDSVELLSVAKPDADVVVMQRPARKWWALIIPFVQQHGVRVVVDVDDRFDHIAKTNKAHEAYDPRGGQGSIGYNKNIGHNWHWINEACRRADLVTATTPDLIQRFGFGKGKVLPNLIPERYLTISGERPETVGWSGSVETHPEDLQVAAGAVSQALQDHGWGFHVIGTGKGVQEALGLSEPPSHTEGWVSFADYPAEMAKMEVGIVPLADTVFNESKSCLKMMEMAAVGVPVIGSPTYDNRRLHKLGVGLMAPSPNKWRQHLNALIKSPDYRAQLSGKGREVMRGQTYERKADRWWSAWTGEERKKVRRAA